MGTAADYVAFCNRYAVESNVTIFNVDYRLCPENKAPAGICDAYAALKHVIGNAEKFGVDVDKIAIFGESGGGWITTGVGMMLAERDEGDLVKF